MSFAFCIQASNLWINKNNKNFHKNITFTGCNWSGGCFGLLAFVKDNRTGLVECTLFIDSANSTENTSTPSGFMIMNYIRPQLRPTPKECIPCVHGLNCERNEHHGPGRIGLPQHKKMGSDGSLLRF